MRLKHRGAKRHRMKVPKFLLPHQTSQEVGVSIAPNVSFPRSVGASMCIWLGQLLKITSIAEEPDQRTWVPLSEWSWQCLRTWLKNWLTGSNGPSNAVASTIFR